MILARSPQICLNMMWVLNTLGSSGGLERLYLLPGRDQRTETLKDQLEGPWNKTTYLPLQI